jgi:anaerobic selenocysteine-containing dehydrogenase
MQGVALEDYVHARLIIVWGCNPSATSIHLVPVIKEARARGARLVVVDPRRIPLARQADLHLAPRPGTDLPVAMALIHWLFDNGRADTSFLAAHTSGADELRRRARAWPVERAAAIAGIRAADLEAVARMYAEASPAVIRCGWGLERNRNGAHSVAAVLAIPAVAGKFGVRGGGYTMSQGRAFGVAGPRGGRAERRPARSTCAAGEELLSGRSAHRALFVAPTRR